MAKSHRYAGNANLRGKKHLDLRCGCCSVHDFREDLNERFEAMQLSLELVPDEDVIYDIWYDWEAYYDL